MATSISVDQHARAQGADEASTCGALSKRPLPLMMPPSAGPPITATPAKPCAAELGATDGLLSEGVDAARFSTHFSAPHSAVDWQGLTLFGAHEVHAGEGSPAVRLQAAGLADVTHDRVVGEGRRGQEQQAEEERRTRHASHSNGECRRRRTSFEPVELTASGLKVYPSRPKNLLMSHLNTLMLQPAGAKAGTPLRPLPPTRRKRPRRLGGQPPLRRWGSSGSPIFLMLLFLPFIFMMWRRNKKETEARSKMKKGDSSVLAGGLIGEIMDTDERIAKVKIAPGVTVQALVTALQPMEEPKARGRCR